MRCVSLPAALRSYVALVLVVGIGGASSACGNSEQPSGSADSGTTDTSSVTDALTGSDQTSLHDATTEATGDSAGPIDAMGDRSCAAGPFDAGPQGPGCPSGIMQCGAPTQCGPVVQSHEVLLPAPAGTGGAIVPGLYFLSGVTIYRSQPGPTDTFQFTLQMTATTLAERPYQNGQENSSIAGTYSTSGRTIHRNITCPTTFSDVDEYTATATTFTIYRVLTPSCFGGTYAETFQLQ